MNYIFLCNYKKRMISKKYNTHIILCSVLILILIGTYFYTIHTEEPFQNTSHSVIPLKIFYTYKTRDVPQEVNDLIDRVKSENPEFEYYLFDDNDCRDFIEEHFDEYVVDAYDTLIPGAFKADLWRLCVLYIHGGIYMDLKIKNVEGVKLISFTDKEYFVRDLETRSGINGVYNVFMAAKPRNPKLKKAIELIVENVQNRFYGNSSLDITGPIFLKRVFTEKEVEAFDLYLTNTVDEDNNLYIDMNGQHVLYKDATSYKAYKSQDKNYHQQWDDREVYREL